MSEVLFPRQTGGKEVAEFKMNAKGDIYLNDRPPSSAQVTTGLETS